VISKNYQPEDNIAGRYLEEIQNDQARLATVNQTIKKYNQALNYCQQDSRDLAIIQLKKVLSMNPKLVRGHQLLALLYIQEGKYDLAKKSLRNAGKIDSNNTTTLRYLKEANAGIKESNPNRKTKNDDLISYQSGNETIIQPRYLKDNTALGTIFNILIGLVIGVAVTYFLVVPGVRRVIQEQTKTEVLEANNSIASKNQQISSLEAQIEDMTAQITDAKDSDEQNESRISTYEQLLVAYSAYVAQDIEGAGTALGNVNTEYLEGDAQTIYDTINAEVNAEYLQTMYREGTSSYSAKDYETAIAGLTKVVELDETYENGNALYYLAQSLRRNENLAEAKVYYQKFIELYPGTERAANAQNYINIEE
jgi:tetratricopeptide (TPR) repeat protein